MHVAVVQSSFVISHLGNIIEHGKCDISGSIYKISGKMSNADEQFEDAKIPVNDMFGLSTVFDPESFEEGVNSSSPTAEILEQQTAKLNVFKIPKSNGDSSSTSPGSHTLSSFSSGSDYLDSDLVKEAIDRLGIEDPQVFIISVMHGLNTSLNLVE